jgi:hypothetical protein
MTRSHSSSELARCVAYAKSCCQFGTASGSRSYEHKWEGGWQSSPRHRSRCPLSCPRGSNQRHSFPLQVT